MPVLITFWILSWIYSILEKKLIDPLAAVVLWKLKWTTSSEELPYWFEMFVAPVIAIILALALLFCLGYFAETTLRRAVDWILLQVPVISHIYSPVRTGRTHQTFSTFATPAKTSSRKSVSKAAALRLRAMLFLAGFRLSKPNAIFLSNPKFSAPWRS
jgi:uncharacterized membrane protein